MELPRVLEQLWGIEGPARPGPKPTFQLSDIGAAAVELADAGGLAAVSMSKVAAALGFTTMSLYRYVDSKDDLYTVMLEYAFGDAPVLSGDTWRERIVAWSEAFRDALRAHPWILQVPITDPPLSPRQLSWLEAGLQAFHDTPLGATEKLSAMLLLNVYVRGVFQMTVHQFTETPEESAAATQRYTDRLRLLATEDRFPAIAGGLRRPEDFDVDFDADGFADGLETVLDGIQARIDKKQQ